MAGRIMNQLHLYFYYLLTLENHTVLPQDKLMDKRNSNKYIKCSEVIKKVNY